MTSFDTGPPMVPSEESDPAQLRLAREQGDAYARALAAMDEESDSGLLLQRAGDWVVGLAVEEAEGLYELRDGELVWREPGEDDAHIEVAVRDAADGRFVPNLRVTVAVQEVDGLVVGTHEHPFLWHPWLYHYGRNWQIRHSGNYAVHIRIEAPQFARHDRKNGRRYTEPVDVRFEVPIEPGRKDPES